jgi:hypothetical protein
MGKATSSMITVVPVLRTAPTAGKSPLRMFHRRMFSAAWSVKAAGRSKGRWPSAPVTRRICSESSPALKARVSTSSAAVSGPSDLR